MCSLLTSPQCVTIVIAFPASLGNDLGTRLLSTLFKKCGSPNLSADSQISPENQCQTSCSSSLSIERLCMYQQETFKHSDPFTHLAAEAGSDNMKQMQQTTH